MASLELRGSIWHLRYRDKRGRSRSVSTKLHTSEKNDVLAQKKLIAFQVDIQRGQYPVQSPKIDALLDNVVTDYKINGKRSLDSLEGHLTHLKPWFGHIRADRFDADMWREYVAHRQPEAKNATINRERAMLRRAFALAVQSGKLPAVPFIPRLKEAPPRSGFVTRQELESLCRHLPEYLRSLTKVAFLTGWRLGELRNLQWRHISFESGEIRLDPGSTKNGEARVFPMTSELRTLLQELSNTNTAVNITPADQAIVGMLRDSVRAKLTPYVFHYPNGQPIGWIYGEWKKAVKKIGKPGLLFHDLRRSAVRNFIQQGMDQRLAMKLTGHRTTDVFLRYQIIAEDDLQRAKRLMEACTNGAQNAQ